MIRSPAALFLTFSLTLPLLAQAGDDWLPGNRYFTVSETLTSAGSYDVLSWLRFDRPPPRPNEKYEREHHFGGWIDRPSEPSCRSTRALVLVRDSRRPVSYDPTNKCLVAQGAWLDTYTGKAFTDPQLLQIDHVVALKHAFIAGAWTWNWKTRCSYSNFMGNRYHLLPVDGFANNQKGDSPPHQWLPPNPAFRCDYLAAWLRVKLIWRLMISEPEAAGILKMVKQLRCQPAAFQMSRDELLQQRQLVIRSQMDCPAAPPMTAAERKARSAGQ